MVDDVKKLAGSWLCLVVLLGSLAGAIAAEPENLIAVSRPATVLAPAERILGTTDAVTIFNKGNELSAIVRERAAAAALSSGSAMALGRGVTIGLRSVRRGAAVVKVAADGYQYPVGLTALSTNAAAPLLGAQVAAVLATGQVVFSSQGAALNNGIQAGDVVDLVADDGGTRSFTVGLVAADSAVGGAELLVSTDTATDLGVTIETRVVLWGFASRGALETALAASGLTTRSDTRIRRSWASFDPDSTLSLASTKQLLGEFSYSILSAEAVAQSLNWVASYLPPGRELLVPAIPIEARCNRRIRADLVAALTEVANAGLSGGIDVDNTNTYGGCYNPRFSRTGLNIGSLSRHAWGGALDINTVTNAQGDVPQLDCRIVRIFRSHNFAWGGNFLTADGMHFEWVGTRRDQYAYPSKYCPNIAPTTGIERGPQDQTLAAAPAGQVGAATLFADDGWDEE